MNSNRDTIFELAAKTFDGWTDSDTNLRVLRVLPHSGAQPGDDGKPLTLHTIYHQMPCFLDGGRRVLLRERGRPFGRCVMDLVTGEVSYPFPSGHLLSEVFDKTGLGVLIKRGEDRQEVSLLDTATGEIVNNHVLPRGWRVNEGHILSDGRRALIQQHKGKPHREHVHSQFYLLDVEGNCELILDEDGFFCNHIQSCPTDPDLFSYDRWPAPMVPTEVIIHLRTLDGSFHEPLPQIEGTIKPGSHWGGQRDHYIWTPDGNYIASYLMPGESDSDNHFDYDWWLSALDWQTGEDLCIQYPPDRWGCHFQASPDSRYLVSGGGRGFQCLYRIEIDKLRGGWNEQVLCTYPYSEENPHTSDLYHFPFVLPDQSGVIFSAGWPGPEAGVYIVEWPQ